MDLNNQNKTKINDTIGTVVGRGTLIKGSIRIKNSGRIDGRVEGGVTSEQDVVVGESGVIEGKVVSRSAIIGGKVLGSINASESVVLEENAELQGDIYTEQLQIADGARFNGYCYMLKQSEKKENQRMTKHFD